MDYPEPILVRGAYLEFNRWAGFLFRHPFTTQVVAEFIDEIEDGLGNPGRYPLEGYSDYRKFGPTRKHRFRIIYTVREGTIWIVAIMHPARRVRYWAGRKLKS
jgi:plasmid stabilization system protein ParE